MGKWFVVFGALCGFLGVAAGAFGAHALKERLSPEMLQVFHTGAQYQMYHALALCVVGMLAMNAEPSKLLEASGWLFLAGILVFSGSLYALALSGIRVLGAVTPLGGLAFLAGWATLAIAAAKR